jgi:hypothetical protein
MEMDMKLRRFSPKTIACYLACMKGVAKHFRKSPAELGDEEIRVYLYYLMEERKASVSHKEPQASRDLDDHLFRRAEDWRGYSAEGFRHR